MQVDPLLANIVIGGISGTVSNMAVFPVELVKTKVQNARSPADKHRFRSFPSAVAELSARKGIAGLWEGSTPVLLGSAPESSIQLAVHSWVVSYLFSSGESSLSLQQQVLAGAVAGAATVVVTNPMEVLRLQAAQNEENEAVHTMAHSLREIGLVGLFSGASATLLRDVPFAALYFTLYCKIKIAADPSFVNQPDLVNFIAGLGAGAVASLFTTPFDLVKTRVQMLNINCWS